MTFLHQKTEKKQKTIIEIGPLRIGDSKIVLMAGPCPVESDDQIVAAAEAAKKAGASVLRGGAFKPRSSPYAFQGLGKEGLELLAKARDITGLPIITEVLDTRDVAMVAAYADIIQIGARNMQNFSLLREVGKVHKPVLLKRGLSATIEEWLMASEYILAEGCEDVILCERGIRTFSDATRFTIDVGAIPVIKEKTHLPIIVDPSHAAGKKEYVEPIALAGLAAGADGLIVEMHPDPEKSLCDGKQSLRPEELVELTGKIKKIAECLGREF